MLNISNFPWSECAISNKRITYRGESLSLRVNQRDNGLHRYDFELVTYDMDMDEGRSVEAQLESVIASGEPLLFVHPRLSFSRGVEPPNGIVVDIAANVGSTSLTVASLTPTEQWQLKAGDYIQFNNDTKIYQVAKDTSLTSGSQIVYLTFPLRKIVTDTTSIITSNIGFRLIATSLVSAGMVASDNQDMVVTLNAVEQL